MKRFPNAPEFHKNLGWTSRFATSDNLKQWCEHNEESRLPSFRLSRRNHTARFPLDKLFKYAHTGGVMRSRSTGEVAKTVGIDKKTLLRWLKAGKVSEPRRHTDGGQDVRLWSNRDIVRVRKFKEANYRKGRGRKKTT